MSRITKLLFILLFFLLVIVVGLYFKAFLIPNLKVSIEQKIKTDCHARFDNYTNNKDTSVLRITQHESDDNTVDVVIIYSYNTGSIYFYTCNYTSQGKFNRVDIKENPD